MSLILFSLLLASANAQSAEVKPDSASPPSLFQERVDSVQKENIEELKKNISADNNIDIDREKALEKINMLLTREKKGENSEDHTVYTLTSSSLPDSHLTLHHGWIIVRGPDAIPLFNRLRGIYQNSNHSRNLPIFEWLILDNLGEHVEKIATVAKNDPFFTKIPEKLVIAKNIVADFLHDLNADSLRLEKIYLLKGPVFSQLKNLKDLVINDNPRIEAPIFAELTQLTSLTIVNSQLNEVPDLKNLKNLERLSLAYNELEDLPDLSQLTQLKELYLSYNKLRQIKNIEKLENLVVLRADHNQLNTSPDLSKNTNLFEVYLSGNPDLNLKDVILPPSVRSKDW